MKKRTHNYETITKTEKKSYIIPLEQILEGGRDIALLVRSRKVSSRKGIKVKKLLPGRGHIRN